MFFTEASPVLYCLSSSILTPNLYEPFLVVSLKDFLVVKLRTIPMNPLIAHKSLEQVNVLRVLEPCKTIQIE